MQLNPRPGREGFKLSMQKGCTVMLSLSPQRAYCIRLEEIALQINTGFQRDRFLIASLPHIKDLEYRVFAVQSILPLPLPTLELPKPHLSPEHIPHTGPAELSQQLQTPDWCFRHTAKQCSD